MDFDVTITYASAGADPSFGESLLEGFLAAAPGSDPIVDQNIASQTSTVAFSVAADDAAAASQSAIEIVRAAAAARDSGGRPTAIHVDATGDRELQAA